jgi:hypothetical protein
MASPRPGIAKQNFNDVWTPAPLLTTNMEGGTAPHMAASCVIQKMWFFVPEEGAEGTNWIGALRGTMSGLDLVEGIEHRLLGPQPRPYISLAIQCGRFHL